MNKMLLMIAAGCAWFFCSAGPLLAQPIGDYTLAEGTVKNAEIVEKAIADAVRDLSFIVRPIAVRKLREAARFCEKHKLGVSRDELSVACDQRPLAISKFDGSPTEYTDEHGESFRLSQRSEGNEIIQVFGSDDGERTNRYHLRPDSQVMDVTVTIVSSHLSKPVQYVLTYNRSN